MYGGGLPLQARKGFDMGTSAARHGPSATRHAPMPRYRGKRDHGPVTLAIVKKNVRIKRPHPPPP